ncbi:SMI1/KNR4 family protein [Streptomyces sp. NPDC090077]|uniref:SMI1/KNR4 family protein n=1 Tax=Streptomyces sp. NPDC090077 TaxID=3365938 RepID=UPI0038090430
MTALITESWTRIENWLAEHAPATYAALAPPADPADIVAAERVIGRPFLKPLRMSLLRHDGLVGHGSSLLPGFYRPLSAREIAADWQSCALYHDKPTVDGMGEVELDHDFMRIGSSFHLYGHPQVIPIARDVCGGHLVLDHRPEIDRGRVHNADAVEGVSRRSHEMWTSLPVLMETLATSLQTNRPVDRDMPVVDENQRLRWDSASPRS